MPDILGTVRCNILTGGTGGVLPGVAMSADDIYCDDTDASGYYSIAVPPSDYYDVLADCSDHRDKIYIDVWVGTINKTQNFSLTHIVGAPI